MVEFCILDYKDTYARFCLDLDTVALVKEMAYRSQYLTLFNVCDNRVKFL